MPISLLYNGTATAGIYPFCHTLSLLALFRSLQRPRTAEVRCTCPDNKSHQPQAMLDQLWIFPLLGIVVGVLAGLLGVGGGLILVGALVWLLPLHGIGHDAAMHAALASSMASIVLTAASSAYAHHRRSEEHTSDLQSLMRTSYAV